MPGKRNLAICSIALIFGYFFIKKKVRERNGQSQLFFILKKSDVFVDFNLLILLTKRH